MMTTLQMLKIIWLVTDGSIGNFYEYVNKKLNGSNGITPLRNKDGQLLYGNGEKSCLLNDYFGSVFTYDNGFIAAQCYA